ncbi:hypothetical protein HPB58_03530 [Priestia filamentosa]|uniref:Uncharacterized protein n=2 Tax=Priestia TaxID=2800373 RepID=A0A0H4KL52_9BACI|nr:hypothetical protein BEH_20665 [Priestia filamentosa]KAB2495662.1 hypothetical protein F8155_06715 [Priestia endophytica]KYG36230.1 hypothetical protein AZF06_03270 [Priestia endophytica]MBG9815168.1 membrane protein [Priestia endophytica]OXS70976.1 hypothetical protein B1B01_01290 [Priestia filamentosa]
MRNLKQRFNSYSLKKWAQNAGAVCSQFIIPLTVFQAVRTIVFPSILDVFLLLIFIAILLSIYFEWI